MAKRRILSLRTQKFIRRSHMYSGLALVPWVLLYGWTAVLFNHGSWMSPWERSRISEVELIGAGWDVPDSRSVAEAAIQQVRARMESGETALSLVEGSIRTVGSFQIEGVRGDKRFRIRASADGGGAFLDSVPLVEDDDELPAWLEAAQANGIDLDVEPDDTLLDAARAAMGPGPERSSIRIRRRPRVECLVRDRSGAEYQLSVPFEPNADVRLEHASGSTALRSKLLRLHFQHGDPGTNGPRALWFLIVDFMGFAMLIWGLSGLVMWWAIKKTRRVGAVALGLGVGTMGVLAVGVWAAAGL